MKKIVYIGILFLALVATSCSKEEVIVNANDNYNAPEWNNSNNEKKSGSGVVDDGPVQGNGTFGDGGTVVGTMPPPLDNPTIGGITDPNNDPDGKKKKF